jgi:hypothetical protein
MKKKLWNESRKKEGSGGEIEVHLYRTQTLIRMMTQGKEKKMTTHMNILSLSQIRKETKWMAKN